MFPESHDSVTILTLPSDDSVRVLRCNNRIPGNDFFLTWAAPFVLASVRYFALESCEWASGVFWKKLYAKVCFVTKWGRPFGGMSLG